MSNFCESIQKQLESVNQMRAGFDGLFGQVRIMDWSAIDAQVKAMLPKEVLTAMRMSELSEAAAQASKAFRGLRLP